MHNCVLVILSAERFHSVQFGILEHREVSLCTIFILQNLECRVVSLCTYIFSWGKPERFLSTN